VVTDGSSSTALSLPYGTVMHTVRHEVVQPDDRNVCLPAGIKPALTSKRPRNCTCRDTYRAQIPDPGGSPIPLSYI
jgi:hypothetical protein